MKSSAMAVLSLMLLGLNNVEANLVTNPSFETFTGSFGGDGGSQLIPGSTTLIGWSIIGNEIGVIKNPNIYNLTPSEGNNFLDLTGYTSAGFPKGVSQTLNGLIAGQTYTFAMDLGVRNGACVNGGNNCTGPIQIAASIGNTSQTFTHNSFDSGNIWGTYGFDFTAVSPSMTLAILENSIPPGNFYIGLDTVSVSAVPLPAAVWLFGTGLLTLGALRKRPVSFA